MRGGRVRVRVRYGDRRSQLSNEVKCGNVCGVACRLAIWGMVGLGSGSGACRLAIWGMVGGWAQLGFGGEFDKGYD